MPLLIIAIIVIFFLNYTCLNNLFFATKLQKRVILGNLKSNYTNDFHILYLLRLLKLFYGLLFHLVVYFWMCKIYCI